MSQRIESPEFVQQLRSGNRDAIRRAVHELLPQVLRTARGAGLSTDEAEDVAQSTFATFLEKLTSFEGRSKVRTWLLGILYRKISELRRQLSRSGEDESIDQIMEDRFSENGTWATPPNQVDLASFGEGIREAIMECLKPIPTKQRLAFALREVEGHSSKEICKILDVSNTNLGVLLFRCRNRLRECLENKGLGADSC